MTIQGQASVPGYSGNIWRGRNGSFRSRGQSKTRAHPYARATPRHPTAPKCHTMPTQPTQPDGLRRNVDSGSKMGKIREWLASTAGCYTALSQQKLMDFLQTIPASDFVLGLGYWARHVRQFDNCQIGVTESVKASGETEETAGERGIKEETGHRLKSGETLKHDRQFVDGKRSWNYYECKANQLEPLTSAPVPVSGRDNKQNKALALVHGPVQEMTALMDKMVDQLLLPGYNPDDIAYMMLIPRDVAIFGVGKIDVSQQNPQSVLIRW